MERIEAIQKEQGCSREQARKIGELEEELEAYKAKVAEQSWRAKSINPVGLPCGVITIDGKGTGALKYSAHETAQRQVDEQGSVYFLSRMFRAVLSSGESRPCIDQMSIGAKTNEMGDFAHFYNRLLEAYGSNNDLFEWDITQLSSPFSIRFTQVEARPDHDIGDWLSVYLENNGLKSDLLSTAMFQKGGKSCILVYKKEVSKKELMVLERPVNFSKVEQLDYKRKPTDTGFFAGFTALWADDPKIIGLFCQGSNFGWLTGNIATLHGILNSGLGKAEILVGPDQLGNNSPNKLKNRRNVFPFLRDETPA